MSKDRRQRKETHRQLTEHSTDLYKIYMNTHVFFYMQVHTSIFHVAKYKCTCNFVPDIPLSVNSNVIPPGGLILMIMVDLWQTLP